MSASQAARINSNNDNNIVVGHLNVTTMIFKHLNMRTIMITTIAILYYEMRHAGAYSTYRVVMISSFEIDNRCDINKT